MKTALIVDDSPLARTVLRKMLAENGVAVDEAASAEAAIEYLQSERPDVVFLDHLMPGMDGFEALQAIKANPDTATIPVMMYTSQDGQLYVSQARALGAVDVLPKNLNPADVKRLLRSHRLLIDDLEPEPQIEQHASEVENTVRDVENAVRDVQRAAQGIVATTRDVDIQELTELVRDMIREQTEILLAELRSQPARMDRESVVLPPPAAIRPQASKISSLGRRMLATTTVITLIAAAGFGSLYVHASRLLAEVNGQIRALSTLPDIGQNTQGGAVESAFPKKSTTTGIADPATLNPSWVEHFAFDSIPLDDDRAVKFGSILAELKNEGFAGSAIVEIHEGLFCLNYTSAGRIELAPPEQPAVACDQIGTPTETVSSTRQSVLFSNMLAVARRDEQFSVETVFHGAARPIVDYPDLDYGVTAGDWNAVAAINQRVSFRLTRAESDMRRRIASMDGDSDLDSKVVLLSP